MEKPKDEAAWFKYFQAHTLRCEVSYRGGAVEIDASELFAEGCKVAAYQNYLGGGIAGSIQSNANFEPEADQRELLDELEDALRRYFYSLNEGGGDEYMHDNVTGPDAGGFEAVQRMDKSAY